MDDAIEQALEYRVDEMTIRCSTTDKPTQGPERLKVLGNSQRRCVACMFNAPSLAEKLIFFVGNGTNLQAIMDACKAGDIPEANVVRVVSNREKAYGLERAKNAGIPTGYVNLLKYKKQHPATPDGSHDAREAFFQDLAAMVLQDKPDIVVCAGFMLVVTPSLLDRLAAAGVPPTIINLHPALPGEFNGINAIERAHEAFQEGRISKSGVMIHYVIKEVDEGAPLLVKELPMIEGESVQDLESRMHDLEHRAIVEGTNIAINQLWKRRNSTDKP